jgi:hypothetical protein
MLINYVKIYYGKYMDACERYTLVATKCNYNDITHTVG